MVRYRSLHHQSKTGISDLLLLLLAYPVLFVGHVFGDGTAVEG